MSRFIKELLVFIVCVIFAIPSGIASAHVLKVDKNIGVVLHVDPADEPVAGEQTNFYFDIKDKQGRYSPSLCECVVDIATQAGETVHQARLFTNTTQSGLSVPGFSFVFPNRGIYKIVFSGKPVQAEAFQGFTLSWDLRVDKGIEAPAADHGAHEVTSAEYPGHNPIGTFVLYAVVIAMILFILAHTLWRKRKARKLPALLLVGFLVAALSFLQAGVVTVVASGDVHDHVHVGVDPGEPHSHFAVGNGCATNGIASALLTAVTELAVQVTQTPVLHVAETYFISVTNTEHNRAPPAGPSV